MTQAATGREGSGPVSSPRGDPSLSATSGASGEASPPEDPSLTPALAAAPLPLDPDSAIRCPSRSLEVPGPVWDLAVYKQGLILRLRNGDLYEYDPVQERATQISASSMHSFVSGGREPLVCGGSARLHRLLATGAGVEPLPGPAASCDAAAWGVQVLFAAQSTGDGAGVGPHWIADPASPALALDIADRVEALAMNGTEIFVADDDKISAYTLPVAARARGDARVLVAEAQAVEALVAHAGELYWAGAGKLRRIPIRGGEPELLVTQQEIADLSFHGGYAYWDNGEGLARIALAKPGSKGRSLEQLVGLPDRADELALRAAGPDDKDGAILWLAPREGGLLELRSAGCDAKAWSRRPAVQGLTPPETLQSFYIGQVDGKVGTFSSSELSASEYAELQELDEDLELRRAGDPRVPARFSPGTRFDLVGVGGRLEGRAESFSSYEGADDRFVDLQLALSCSKPSSRSAAPQSAPERCLGVDEAPVLVFRAGEARARLELREPKALAPGPLLDTIGAQAHAQAKLAGAKIGPRFDAAQWDLVATPATLARGGAYALALTYEGEAPDREDELEQLSALGVFDARGQFVEWIEAPGWRLDSYTVDMVLDLNGDGVDELIYTAAYYEGAFTFLLQHRSKGYGSERLDGDGA